MRKLLASIIILLLGSFCINAQRNDMKVSVHVVNETLINVLDILSKQTGLEFCYDSEYLPTNKVVTVSTDDVPLDNYFEALFSGFELEYKVVDNQVLLFKPKPKEVVLETKKEPVIIPKKESSVPKKSERKSEFEIIKIYDTIQTIVFDTVDVFNFDTIYTYIFDTLKVTHQDTIFFYDTIKTRIYRNYPPPYKKSIELYSCLNRTIGNNHLYDVEGISLAGDSVETKNFISWAYQVGLGINYYLHGVLLHSGLAWTTYNEKVDFTDNQEEYLTRIYIGEEINKVQETVILDSFYMESAWHYTTEEVEKTVRVPVSSFSIDTNYYKRSSEYINRFTFFYIPLEIGKSVYISQKFTATARIGILAGFYVQSNRLMIDQEKYRIYSVNEKSSIRFGSISYHSRLSIEYHLTEKIGLYTGIDYAVQPSFQVSGIDIRNYRQIGANIGIYIGW